MDLSSLTPSQLRQAADLQEKIEALKAQLAQILGGTQSSPAPASIQTTRKQAGGKKGGMSPEGRARIAAAARKRWAKFHADQGANPAAPKKKRKLSAAGRAAIIAAAKARWAREKAGKGK
jgi:hypothetical protein